MMLTQVMRFWVACILTCHKGSTNKHRKNGNGLHGERFWGKKKIKETLVTQREAGSCIRRWNNIEPLYIINFQCSRKVLYISENKLGTII